ncbi:MAG: type II secretion system protein GspD [Lysobacter sp.]|nr:MAG: type II secretion system protein GspD [Lysobacter sp.]
MNRSASHASSAFTTAAATFALVLALGGCAVSTVPTIKRAPATDTTVGVGAPTKAEPLPEADAKPQAQISRGSGEPINRRAAATPPPDLGATSGEARFNFEGESLHAVVKAILGDMLGQNYVIAPSVQGTVTYSTPRPVSAGQALSVLEMILGWNNAAMIYSDGRYSIVPADQAMGTGVVSPRVGSAANARGFESRVVPLKFISATEMEKLLKPYARPNAIVNVDANRNIITVAGTRAELDSYMRTIEIFDVDWMATMSVGVFPVQSSKAKDVVANLEKVFGEAGKSPLAGMIRFMPLEGANAVLAVTAQPKYLTDVQQWIDRIDSAGQGVKLYSYELKYVTAKDLSQRLGEVFGGRGGGSGGDFGGNASIFPGLQSTVIDGGGGKDGGFDSGSGGTGGGLGGGQLSLDPRQGGGNASVTLEVGADKVAVAAIEENNTLLVRATPAAWRSILEVIEKLDVLPMQVHIESQVAEVTLTGDLSYGVNWFFERAVTDNGLPDALGRDTWSTLAGSIKPAGGANPGLAWTFLGRNAAAVISALDQVTDVRLLQTGSVLARNNSEATLNVGSRIPVTSVSVNPVLGNNNSISQVQYLDTGVILKVRPRVTKDGTVFLDIVQEVSSPGSVPDANGNVRIDTRRLKTTAIVPTGETVMLAGLIKDSDSKGASGFPGLSRIPVVGGLFGRQTKTQERSEVIVLLTPTIVRDQRELLDLTDEYSQQFRAMEPIEPVKIGPKKPTPHR